MQELKETASGASEPRQTADTSRLEELIQAGFSDLLNTFQQKLAYDAGRQKQIDVMHEELVHRRADLVTRAARPLVNGVIRLHDDIGKISQSLLNRSGADFPPEKFCALLQGLQEDIEILLSHNGIATFREPTDTFAPLRQRAVRAVPTGDPTLAGKVAERLRPGFEQGAELIEKERVAAYDFKTAAPENKD